jgi:hypothetical protein
VIQYEVVSLAAGAAEQSGRQGRWHQKCNIYYLRHGRASLYIVASPIIGGTEIGSRSRSIWACNCPDIEIPGLVVGKLRSLDGAIEGWDGPVSVVWHSSAKDVGEPESSYFKHGNAA